MARWKNFRKYGFRSSVRYFYGKYRGRFNRRSAIASTPYIAGAAIGFTGIADRYIPPQFQNLLMIVAVLPGGVTSKIRGLGTLKAVAQGYILGRVAKGITGFSGINAASGVSGGPWL